MYDYVIITSCHGHSASASVVQYILIFIITSSARVLKHPNTLSLMGVCSQGPTIMVLLEYCSHGNLKTFLVRKRREAAAIKERGLLLRMACEMAAGLMYLHSKNIAHKYV